MAFAATAWAWTLTLPTTQKFVLVALADMADEEMSCFPSHRTIGRMVGASSRTVARAIVSLEESGLLSRAPRVFENGARGSDRYYLTVGATPLDNLSGAPDTEGGTPLTNAVCAPLIEQPEESIPTETAGDRFDEFWSTYPRKVGKAEARKRWTAATKSTPAEVIVAGAQRFARDPNLPDRQFIPHPSTWLSRGSWEDEALPTRQQPAPQRGYDSTGWLS